VWTDGGIEMSKPAAVTDPQMTRHIVKGGDRFVATDKIGVVAGPRGYETWQSPGKTFWFRNTRRAQLRG